MKPRVSLFSFLFYLGFALVCFILALTTWGKLPIYALCLAFGAGLGLDTASTLILAWWRPCLFQLYENDVQIMELHRRYGLWAFLIRIFTPRFLWKTVGAVSLDGAAPIALLVLFTSTPAIACILYPLFLLGALWLFFGTLNSLMLFHIYRSEKSMPK